MTWAVWINETRVDTVGFYVERITGWPSGPDRSYPTQAIVGRLGAVLSEDPSYPPRSLTLAGSIRTSGNSLSSRVAFEQQLKGLAYRGLVTITLDDDVTDPVQIDGVCTRATITPKTHPMTSPVSTVELAFLCPDPAVTALVGSLVAFGATATPVPLGTAPSGGIIRIAAPSWSANVVNPTVTYYASAGTSVQTMAFTATLVAGQDYLEIDLDRATVVLSDNGSRSNGISLLTSGDFFALDPLDGDVANTAYPLLSVSASSGTPSGTLAYRKRWL